METSSKNRFPLLASEALPGTRAGSDLQSVYESLAAGNVLTTLDAVFTNNTVCLTKYISLLRNKYGIPVKDKWVKISERKQIKQFWLEQ